MSDSGRANKSDDALLSGLGRLRVSDNARTSRASRHTFPETPLVNTPYAYIPPPPSVRPLAPVSHTDLLEVIEHATGLGRYADGDPAAADKLVGWVRGGRVAAGDVLRAIVSGRAPTDARLNARVLSVVQWLCVAGGPLVLPAAVYARNPRRPSAGLKVVLDVLESVGGGVRGAAEVEDALYDDSRVWGMRVRAGGVEGGVDGSGGGEREVVREAVGEEEGEDGGEGEVRGWRRATPRQRVLVAGVQAYAIALGRKLVFHKRYPEVEGNYSLDRHFRKMHVENGVDRRRAADNMERHAVLISKVTAAEVGLIARAAAAAADRLERGGAADEVVALVVSEACNAWSFAEYVRMKIGVRQGGGSDGGDLEEVRRCVEGMVGKVRARGGAAVRILKRFADGAGLAAVGDGRVRPGRPESRHRREVVCTFSSFEAMHMALRPHLQGHYESAT